MPRKNAPSVTTCDRSLIVSIAALLGGLGMIAGALGTDRLSVARPTAGAHRHATQPSGAGDPAPLLMRQSPPYDTDLLEDTGDDREMKNGFLPGAASVTRGENRQNAMPGQPRATSYLRSKFIEAANLGRRRRITPPRPYGDQ
jgi:hypothetical protein